MKFSHLISGAAIAALASASAFAQQTPAPQQVNTAPPPSSFAVGGLSTGATVGLFAGGLILAGVIGANSGGGGNGFILPPTGGTGTTR